MVGVGVEVFGGFFFVFVLFGEVGVFLGFGIKGVMVVEGVL